MSELQQETKVFVWLVWKNVCDSRGSEKSLVGVYTTEDNAIIAMARDKTSQRIKSGINFSYSKHKVYVDENLRLRV